jgi:pyridoxal phosphate enzyme (YggS family)
LGVEAIRGRIAEACRAAGRSVDSVTLLAVSKGQSTAAIEAAARAGLVDFGENFVQESLGKIRALSSSALCWHFIGRLQANKTRPVAEHFAWVHSIDRARIAERLSAQRPFHAPPLNLCLQLHVGGEDTKGGVAATELPRLADELQRLPRLKLRGLMCMPPAEGDVARQRGWFREARAAFDDLNRRGLGLDTLSMGTSADFEAAIAEGATMVRIGTALFGPRPQTP